MKFNKTPNITTKLIGYSLQGLLTFCCYSAFAFEKECRPDPYPNDPLIIDLGQDGIHLGAKGVGVLFDLMVTGTPVKMQWTALNGDEAFVAIDKNGNGIIDDGSELFTNYNPLLLEGTTAPNGFADLAQYDQVELGGNDDGIISDADQIWSSLYLWQDRNADGTSIPAELFRPSSFGITQLSTIPREHNKRDPAGNLLLLWSWTQKGRNAGNNKYRMVDVFFQPIF